METKGHEQYNIIGWSILTIHYEKTRQEKHHFEITAIINPMLFMSARHQLKMASRCWVIEK